MQLDHRGGDHELKHYDSECRPGGGAHCTSLAALADAKEDSNQMSEQEQRDYPMRYLNHERSAVLSDDSTPRKSLAGYRCPRSIRSESAKYERDKSDCNR